MQARSYTPSALPSTTARLLAFVAILLGGSCGAVIGWSVTDLQCGPSEQAVEEAESEGEPVPEDDCGVPTGVGAVVGAGVGAGGVAVVAVLVLRAMAEWRRELEVDEIPAAGPPTTGT